MVSQLANMETVEQKIEDLRDKFFQKLDNDADPDRFHPVDIAKIKSGNDWLRRFLKHCDMDVNVALNMMWDSCEWRKTVGANDINESNVKREYLDEGNMFVHNRDIDGKSLLIMKSKKHIKGQKNMDDLKRCTIYWFERLQRMDKGDQISIFFDLADTGLSNIDMEYTKYLINLFKVYYPDFLNYILVFEMPWVLNAAFKIIKSWLPAKAVQKIKFCTKSNLSEYIPAEQMLACWGGLDDYEFVFVPEDRTAPEDGKKKTVHFADGSPMVETFPSFSEMGGGVDGNPIVSGTNSSLSIVPHDTISFVSDGVDLTGSITLTNVGDKIVSYKIKTTSPEKFRVRPSSGTLALGASVTIHVLLQPGYQLPALTRDKFLIMHLPAQSASMSAAEVADLWKQSSAKSVEQHRLKCSIALSSSSTESSIRNGTAYGTMSQPDVGDRQLMQLIAKVAQLNENHVRLHTDVKSVRRLLWFTVFLVVSFGVAILYILKYEQADENHGQCYADVNENL